MLQSCFSLPPNPNPQFQFQFQFQFHPQPNPLTCSLPQLNSSPSVSSSPPTFLPLPTLRTRLNPRILSCTGNPTNDYQRRPVIRWKDIYNKVWLLDDPENGVSGVLDQCEIDGKTFQKSELFMFIRNLRKFRRYHLALEVLDWMSNKPFRFDLFKTSDTAIKLDLIAKVHGIPSAEDFFTKIPDNQKDRRVYGALLNAYVEANDKERAEPLMEKMKREGYASYPLSFNRMLSLYMKLKEYQKFNDLILEMKRSNIRLDLFSYNIWLFARGSQGSIAGLEEVFREMEQDQNISPHWSTFSSMASSYIMLGELEKAKGCMRRLEATIDQDQDRSPYHYLLNLYGRVGEKEEVYRVWGRYKSQFEIMTNWGYHSMIHSLVQVGDIQGAEKFYDEWFSVKSTYDARISNILLGWYVKNGNFEKVDSFFSHMEKAGGKLIASSWVILAGYHMKQRRILDALMSFRRAKSCGYWRPNSVQVSAFLEICEQEGDEASKEEMMGLLSEMGFSKEELVGDDPSNVSYHSHEDDEVGWSGNKDSELLVSAI